MNKGRAARYGFYAAGEILLVITGILIALAVAEWNNDRHEQFREHELLMELREALRIDRDVISRGLERAQRHVENIKTLKGLMASGSPLAAEETYPLFGSAYGTISVRLNQAIYEDLKSSGLGLIRSNPLRLQIIDVFENEYIRIDEIRVIETNVVLQVMRPYFLSHFHDIRFLGQAIPNDIGQVWTDGYFKNIIDYRMTVLESNQLAIYTEALAKVDLLTASIDDYAKRYEPGEKG